MQDEGQPTLYQTIDQLLTEGSFEAAKQALDGAPKDNEFHLLRVKHDLLTGSLPAGVAMQKLIQLMRQSPDLPGAKALYQQASKLAYSDGQSSISHSHPPPPVRSKDGH